MAEWQRDNADYEFQVPGYENTTRLTVQGAMDPSENNRPKLILADRSDNCGPSVLESPAMEQCINSLSESMKIQPREADWFTRNRDGEIHALSVGFEKVVNPQYTEREQSNDLSLSEIREARKYFPDIDQLKATQQDLTPREHRDLTEAFGGLEQVQAPNKEESQIQESQKSGHEYNLSQEQIH